MVFRKYKRTNVTEMHEFDPMQEYPLDKISISQSDLDNGSPKKGDMIARNPENHNDMWLVAEEYFKANFALIKE